MAKNGMAEIVAKPGGLHSLINAKPLQGGLDRPHFNRCFLVL